MTDSRWSEGQEVSLGQMLAAREMRVKRRQEALDHYCQPTITLSVVMPGAVKLSAMTRAIAAAANSAISLKLRDAGWDYRQLWSAEEISGPEALYAVACPPDQLKRAMVELEEGHKLGRLWDLDVHACDGKGISRKDLDLPPRSCLVCAEPAHACARSRTHQLAEILTVMEDTVRSFRGG
ncbi:citrate lyase holo-[acyl-carrier protein] synthase [uncultured Cohaesibacter sp.]|uniref:citrate lyase holo-[acyl-carrier protein] synthase n=1 Tax=uncultured Cohaesibacter sp. TaxID=1002546 RepID=UPI0029C65E72|nr:citrate lyase holo-[acyl-carrier protein] synthase [uncultured Cohaesibacter sp.]